MYPDQDTIRIQVYQGEHPIASHNTPLANFLITDLKPTVPTKTQRSRCSLIWM